MKAICPYCGKQQSEKNTSCQFCGASLQAMVPDQSGKPAEEKGPTTALCNMCMKSFPVAELVESEGQKICAECLKKTKRRETSLGPALRKAATEELTTKPGKKLAVVLVVGLLFLTIAGYGGYYFWNAVSLEKQRRMDNTAKLFQAVIEKNNQAVAFLHQYETEPALAAEAVTILVEALSLTSSDEIRGACLGDATIEAYRTGVKELIRKRLMAARTLAGTPEAGDPDSSDSALKLISQTDASAPAVTVELAKLLRMWRVSVQPFMIY
jgi:hypothetical protein